MAKMYIISNKKRKRESHIHSTFSQTSYQTNTITELSPTESFISSELEQYYGIIVLNVLASHKLPAMAQIYVTSKKD